jgi:peptidoglycan/xylan/chitin deacetylase (PgdA/CDA1 family)
MINHIWIALLGEQKIPAISILAVLAVVYCSTSMAYGESSGTVNILVKNEGDNLVDTGSMRIVAYKDFEKTPFAEVYPYSNPYQFTSLQLGHKYRFEVYLNSMFGDVGYVTLDKPEDTVKIKVKNEGGMRLAVFYKDGETPIVNAKIKIKAFDGTPWIDVITHDDGQTNRMWIYPTTKENEHYFAEIYLGPEIKYTSTQLKLQAGAQQDYKIVTSWPTIVDKLITVEVYNNTKAKVSKLDGVFTAYLLDGKKTKVAESQVTDKGIANFAKLKVNNYVLQIKKKMDTGELKTIAAKKLTITDATGVIKVYLNNPELNSDHLNCNCVAFRLDDIQDYFLAPAQIELFSLFKEKDTPLTIGVIGGLVGTDENLVNAIKNDLASNKSVLEIASHSLNNRVMTSLTKQEQEDFITKTSDKVFEIFGVRPKVFIPPENLFNDDTISILKNNGFTHVSYDASTSEPPVFKKSDFYHFPILPYTAELDREIGYWKPISNDQILEKINDSLLDYGYAVVMMHPYEFSAYEEGRYVNKVNDQQVAELGKLIDKIRSENIKILPLGSIQYFDKPISMDSKKSTEPDTEKPTSGCNCLAFRLDNIQDYWLNDVQGAIIDTFDKKDTQLTVSVIGKFIGEDPKTVGLLKEKLDIKNIRIANRGWEYVDHTALDKQKQKESIIQTNEKIAKTFGVRATMFSPPDDKFNDSTIYSAKEAKMTYFSSNIEIDVPPFGDTIKHVPTTLHFEYLNTEYAKTGQNTLEHIQWSIEQYGFATISMQPPDFAIKTDVFQNEIDKDKIALLEKIIDDAKSQGIEIVLLEKIPTLLEDKSIVIPEWVKENTGQWSEGKTEESDFTKGLEYLIEQKIIKIPASEEGIAFVEMPGWLKNNAKWWAQGKIGNSDFVKGIQYLIEHEIIAI